MDNLMDYFIYVAHIFLCVTCWCISFSYAKNVNKKNINTAKYSPDQIHNFFSVIHNLVSLCLISMYYLLDFMFVPFNYTSFNYINLNYIPFSNFIIYLLLVWSNGYYIFDCFNYLGKLNTPLPKNYSEQITMIMHHIGTIYTESYLFDLVGPFTLPLENTEMTRKNILNARVVLFAFFWSEISNYPMYYIYHLKHTLNVNHTNMNTNMNTNMINKNMY